MAASNGSTAERPTDLHRCITDGSIEDHLWCAQRPDQVIEGKAYQRCAKLVSIE
ncbi:hypothetical protein ACF1G0_30190 [Streptomyces sp. NPDC013953]|uniref:hypothetical protein n=1 Tax=Streptomyces sp. NPDC013953 TaxID=3364868 RepID=UPI0036FE362D